MANEREDFGRVTSVSVTATSRENTPQPSPNTMNAIDEENKNTDNNDENKNEEKPLQWKIFHWVLIGSCITGPTLLMVTWISAAYANGKTLSCCSVSGGIGGAESYGAVVFFTIISAILSMFVSICRQIQIRVKFQEYEDYKNVMQWMNNIALGLNLSGYTNLVLLTIFDSRRYSLAHVIFSGFAFICSGLFAYAASIITIRERNIEYKKNLEIYHYDKWIAFKNTFFFDAIAMTTLIILSTIFILIYVGQFFTLNNAATTTAQVPGYANVCEWLAFFCAISIVIALASSFHHDNVDDELIKFFKLEGKIKGNKYANKSEE